MIFIIRGSQSKPVINHVYELHQHGIKQSNKTEQKQGDGRADESAPASESREVHHGEIYAWCSAQITAPVQRLWRFHVQIQVN